MTETDGAETTDTDRGRQRQTEPPAATQLDGTGVEETERETGDECEAIDLERMQRAEATDSGADEAQGEQDETEALAEHHAPPRAL